MEWQPIATAPQDGTPIDVWVASYGDGHRITDASWTRPISRWGTSDGGTRETFGPWGWYSPRFDPLTGPYAPIYWMPAPAPPQVPARPSVKRRTMWPPVRID